MWKKFRTKSQLNYHVSEVHVGATFECDKCDHKTTTYNGMRKHKRNKHDGVEFNVLIVNIRHLAAHALGSMSRINTSVLKQKCPQCDYKASTKFSLNIHKRNIE